MVMVSKLDFGPWSAAALSVPDWGFPGSGDGVVGAGPAASAATATWQEPHNATATAVAITVCRLFMVSPPVSQRWPDVPPAPMSKKVCHAGRPRAHVHS